MTIELKLNYENEKFDVVSTSISGHIDMMMPSQIEELAKKASILTYYQIISIFEQHKLPFDAK